MIVRTINGSRPDLLIVGLSTPLQQTWVRENAAALEVPVIPTGGAYLDKLADGLNWSPRWMDRARLGWLYCVIREPRRLWRRYLFGAFAYGALVLREIVRKCV